MGVIFETAVEKAVEDRYIEHQLALNASLFLDHVWLPS
jgi:hypothetical protein